MEGTGDQPSWAPRPGLGHLCLPPRASGLHWQSDGARQWRSVLAGGRSAGRSSRGGDRLPHPARPSAPFRRWRPGGGGGDSHRPLAFA